MIIGVRAHDLEFDTINDMCQLCKEHSIDGIQLVIKRTFSERINDEKYIDSQIKQIQDMGIEIFLLGAYFNMIHPDDYKLAQGIETFKLNAQIAKRNKLLYVGSETGSVNGDEWTYHPDNHTAVSYTKLKTTIEQITANLELCKLLIEPVYDHVAHNVQVTKAMKINDDIGIIFDISNMLNCKNYLDYVFIFENFLKEFGNEIKVFHFKNFTIEDGKKNSCALDKGIIDYKLLYSLLKQYKLTHVPIIIEELQSEQLFESIKYLRKLETS